MAHSCGYLVALLLVVCLHQSLSSTQDVPVSCGGFVKSDFPVDFTIIQVKLYSAMGTLRDSTVCASINGYFLFPLYERGDFIIKVDAPEGWKIEPSDVSLAVDGVNDRCSKGEDINFQLLGFSVYGHVVSSGLEVGPRGVSLNLEQNGAVIQSLTSDDNGRFMLEGVPPGQYQLTASHSRWMVSQSPVRVTVSDGSVEVPVNSLVVLGYDVKGQVASDGAGIPGVKFYLYPQSETEIDCKEPEAGDVRATSRIPKCVAVSDRDGQFEFPCLPPGTYDLVPFYRQNEIDFKVHPTVTQFSVVNDSFIFESTFKVHGFSVSGQILEKEKGRGIVGAKIFVNGDEIATTNELGRYQLANVTTGRYSIKVVSPDVEFEEVVVHLSPSNPNIPLIVPSKYLVCGDVKIPLPPSPTIDASFREVRVLSVTSRSGPAVVVETVRTLVNGEFCVMLPLGKYKLMVSVSSTETAHGLIIQPAEHSLVMVGGPVMTKITFEQFLATLSGTIACIGECVGDVEVSLNGPASEETNGQTLTTKVVPDGKAGNFTFKNVLPGNVKVSIQYEQWCWGTPSLELTLGTKSPPPVTFTQTGFSMRYKVSHETPVTYYIENGTEVDVVLMGSGQKCLKQPGVYVIQPKSCYKFDKDQYQFDTSSSSPLVLSADSHYVSVSVLAEEQDGQLFLRVNSLRFGSKDETLTPVNVVEQTATGSSTQTWKYFFTFLARPHDEVDISPLSTKLMFSPPTTVVTISNECPEEIPPFIGSLGLMVTGRVEPPLEGVAITIQTEQDEVLTVKTDQQGQYRAGPLRGGKQPVVNADLDGYMFEAFESDSGSFKALKLSKIVIKVVSDSGSVLNNVLVSLSGANFRSNNFTNNQGTLSYYRINPGQYFVKALLREYVFQPVSKIIELTQGEIEEIVFTGSRVAFSCSGHVTTLNHQPLEGEAVTATALGESEQCLSFNGKAVTGSIGEYRLRGLMPGCSYTVFVVTDGSGIQHTIPNSKFVSVTGQDVVDVKFMAVLRATQVFITGNVVTEPKLIGTLKAQLLSDTKSVSVIASTGIDSAGFFDFPSVPVQEGNYIVSIESSLSPHAFNFTRDEKVIPGDRDSHVALTFSAEEIVLEQESQRGSVIALIIAVLVVFALVNIEKAFAAVQTIITSLGTNGIDSISSGTDSRRKTGRKR